jgi:hypothetical protein
VPTFFSWNESVRQVLNPSRRQGPQPVTRDVISFLQTIIHQPKVQTRTKEVLPLTLLRESKEKTSTTAKRPADLVGRFFFVRRARQKGRKSPAYAEIVTAGPWW